jgi:flagellar hook-associated protein 2
MEPVDKANRQTATLMKTLDIGSGVDIESLARSLADAETASRINTTKTRMASVENRMSGYAVVSSFLDDFKRGFDGLQNVSELFTTSASSSDSARVPVSLTGDAAPGQYNLSIQSLAGATVIQSASFVSSAAALNSGSAFQVGLQIGSGAESTINVSDDTPAGLVSAINAASLGVRATLVNKSASGNDWQIVLQGSSGEAADFSITSSTAATGLGFADPANRLATARDAEITLNGMTGIKRSSNRITDVIPGVMLDLKSNPGADVAIIIERSSQPMKQKLQTVVDAYNQFNTVLDELSRQPTEGSDEFTGSLQRDKQFVTTLRAQMKALMIQESSTPGGAYQSLRDIGLSFSLDGTAQINQQQLDLALATDEDAVATMLSAGTNGTSNFSVQPKGLAQDISIKLAEMLSSGGVINQRKTSAKSQISVYERDLVKLEVRLEAIYQRYISQFSAMESLVQRMEGIGSYLKGQFTAMENMYKN